MSDRPVSSKERSLWLATNHNGERRIFEDWNAASQWLTTKGSIERVTYIDSIRDFPKCPNCGSAYAPLARCACGKSPDETKPEPPPTPQWLAVQFHETYERLAPKFGYETRRGTRHFDPESPNGRLMIAVCTELLQREPALKPSAVETESNPVAVEGRSQLCGQGTNRATGASPVFVDTAAGIGASEKVYCSQCGQEDRDCYCDPSRPPENGKGDGK